MTAPRGPDRRRRAQVERDGWSAQYTTDARTSLTPAPTAGPSLATASTLSPSPPVQRVGARCEAQPGGRPYVLTALAGVLSDGTLESSRGAYLPNANCSWLIRPALPTDAAGAEVEIALTFINFDVEFYTDWIKAHRPSAIPACLWSCVRGCGRALLSRA
jgi:hypothetical protein